MSDESFREIQLNGKQLVFLFMAATVVSVVIFLCGVLVGRGVRGSAGLPEMSTAEIVGDSSAPAPDSSTTASTPSSSSAPSTPAEASPPAPAEQLSYAERLLRDAPPEENLSPPPPKPVEQAPPAPVVKESVPPQPTPRPAPPPSAAVAPTPAASPPSTAAGSAPAGSISASDPSGPGFAVQVAISKNRQEADTLAKNLISKGYPAFVMDPAKGAPAGIYRVRVGKYKTRKDAEEIAARLKTAEHFEPWIAR